MCSKKSVKFLSPFEIILLLFWRVVFVCINVENKNSSCKTVKKYWSSSGNILDLDRLKKSKQW